MAADEYDLLLDSISTPKTKGPKTRPTVDYRQLYNDVGAKHGVDPDLLYNQAKHESVNFNPHFVYGPGRSPKGAAGLAQFMPDTGRQYGLKVQKGQDDRFNPAKAADAHARLMKDLIDRYGDNRLALAAYNAGTGFTPQQAQRAMQRIPETRNYVQKIAPQGDQYDQLLDNVGQQLSKQAQTAQPKGDEYDDLLDSIAAPQRQKVPHVTSEVRPAEEEKVAPIKFQPADNSELNKLARSVQGLSDRAAMQGLELPKNYPNLVGKRLQAKFDHPPTAEEVDDALLEQLGKGYGGVGAKFRTEMGVPLTANSVAVEQQPDGSYLAHAAPSQGFVDAVNAYAQGGRSAYENMLTSQQMGKAAVARDVQQELKKGEGVAQDLGQAGAREVAANAQFMQNAADLVRGRAPEDDPNARAIARARESIPSQKTYTGAIAEVPLQAAGAITRAEALGGTAGFPASAAIGSAEKGPEAAYKAGVMTAPMLAAGPIAESIGVNEMSPVARQVAARGIAGAGLGAPAIASGASPKETGLAVLEGAAFPIGGRRAREAEGLGLRNEKAETQPNVTAQPESAQPARVEAQAVSRMAPEESAVDTASVPATSEPVATTVIRHSNPRIDGGEVVGRTSDGKLKVQNNEGSISTVKNPRTQGNREATIVKTPAESPAEPATPERQIPTVEAAQPARAETTASIPEVVKPWEMTRQQIEEEFQRKKAEDNNLEASILGPELAKKYDRLQRAANSSYDTEKANKASVEIEKIEASLSERDRNRLYGIGEEGPQVDELRDYRQSLGNLDDYDPQSLAESMKWAVSRVGNETDPAKMNHDQRVAYGTLREAARIAYENGWDTQAISREAVKAAGERFADPEDARFMLDRFSKKEPAPTVPERKQLAPPPPPPKAVAETPAIKAETPPAEAKPKGKTVKGLPRVYKLAKRSKTLYELNKENEQVGVIQRVGDQWRVANSDLPRFNTPEEAALAVGRRGEAGYVNPSLEKVEYKPATTPILKDVERATRTEGQRPTLSQLKRRATSYIQRALIAEFTPLRELEKTLYGKETVPVVNMARKFEQVAGAPAKAQADIIDFRKNVVDPIRKSADDFNSYLFLKRVEDRLLQDPERKRVSDWSVEKARKGLDELKSKVGEDVYTNLERQGKVYQQEMDKALRLQVESGRMSQELYDNIKASNDFYAPFKVLRYIEDHDLMRGAGRRVATTQELSKKITGIDSEDFQLGNILQASAEQIVRSRILAEKNLKMLELDKLAERDPDGVLIRKITQDKERPRHGYEFVRYFKDGKEQVLEVDHTVANAIQGLNPKQASLIAQTMALAKKPLQIGATSANAGFQAVNLFFADAPRAALVSRYGVKNIKDVYQFPLDWGYSLFSSMKGNFGKPNQLYMDWLRSGAANSTIQRELTPEAFRPTLGIAKPGAKHLASSVLNSVAQFSNAIEETSKVLGLKRGMRAENYAKLSPAERQQAMEKIAAEVRNYSGSPDFARKGSETRDLNLLFMFFNARLQGVTADLTRLAGKTGTKEAAQAWGRLGVGIALPSAMLAAVNHSGAYKEDYDKVPDWEKKSYWMIPRESYFTNEDGERVRDYWRIPKREIGQLIGNTTESAVRFAMKRDPKVAKDWAVDMVENISPISIQGRNLTERAESVFSSTNPALKLPAELLMNRDTFRHRNIVPDYMRKAAPGEQYRESTPSAYKKVGQALNVSPLKVQHVSEGLTGSAASQFNIRPQEEGRSSLGRYPILKRFVRSGATQPNEQATQEEELTATEQLKRKRVRDAAISDYRAGRITENDLKAKVDKGELTQSDIATITKKGELTPRQAAFSNATAMDALARYERMSEAQRSEVKDIMEKHSWNLTHSDALTTEQKERNAERLKALGIEPAKPKRKSSSAFSRRFLSAP